MLDKQFLQYIVKKKKTMEINALKAKKGSYFYIKPRRTYNIFRLGCLCFYGIAELLFFKKKKKNTGAISPTIWRIWTKVCPAKYAQSAEMMFCCMYVFTPTGRKLSVLKRHCIDLWQCKHFILTCQYNRYN